MSSRMVALAVLLASTVSVHAEPSATIVPVGFEVSEFRGPSSRVAATVASTDGFRESRPPLAGPLVVVWGQEGAAVLSQAQGKVSVRPARAGSRDLASLEKGRNALSGSRSEADGPLSVQLEDPTRDYPHEALGSGVHARTLVIRERKPAPPSTEAKPVAADTVRISAGDGAVFEDREPHILDLDGDGTPEILVVKSYRDRGSALAVVARRDGTWRIVAETPPDGEPFRWLNPVATVAAGGKGPAGLVMLVRRPHLDGVLQAWRFKGDALTLTAEKAGYANHVYGSAAQDLASLYLDGGKPRLALPTLDRRALAILSVGDRIDEVARIALPARAATGVAVLGAGADLRILVGLEDGRIADVKP